MPYQLVIFDMDGTLTEELLDFPAIRRAIGVPENHGILEHIAALPADQQSHAHAILDRHELAAADTCRIHDGAAALLGDLRNLGIKTALLTRNSAPCARRILERHALSLDYVATREDLPHKPHADSILNITARFAIPAPQTLMVGDYLYDLQAAKAAQTDSALLLNHPHRPLPPFIHLATYTILHLAELLPLIRRGPIQISIP